MQKIKLYVCLLLCIFFIQQNIQAQDEDSLKLALAKVTNDTARIKILSELAEVCDYNDILIYAEPAKALCEKALAAKQEPAQFYLSNLASAVNNIGFFYSKKGDREKALENYKASLKIYQQLDDKKNTAYQLNNIAFIYNTQGNVPVALEYFYQNLKVQEQIKDTSGIAFSLNNIGYVFFNQQDHKNAMDYYTKSMRLFESIGNTKGVAMALANIGTVYGEQKNRQKALEYYTKSLVLYEKAGDKYSAAHELNSIGFEYAAIGQDDTALNYFNRALAIANAFQSKQLISYGLSSIARILLKKGNIDTAEAYALRSLQLGREAASLKDIQNPAGILKDVYVKKGNYKEAYTMYGLEIQMRDSLVNERNSKQAIAKNLQYQYEKKELLVKFDNERKIARKNMLIYISLFVAVVIALLSFFYARQNKLKTKLERMELEQQQYRSQMNPHFIFNCLNSIQHYIVHNDVMAANKYLSEFASLMRQTLENNKLHTITLQQEIDYLNSYLTLEQMRFENKFTYAVSTAADVNVFDTQILPTLIQPFAENAILHGLCFLEKDGKLLISFEILGDCLVCKIDDNGIGRKASQELKKQTGKAHVSQGMELIKKRLALASTISKRKFDVEIIDKISDEGKASGTLVILKFPIGI